MAGENERIAANGRDLQGEEFADDPVGPIHCQAATAQGVADGPGHLVADLVWCQQQDMALTEIGQQPIGGDDIVLVLEAPLRLRTY